MTTGYKEAELFHVAVLEGASFVLSMLVSDGRLYTSIAKHMASYA